MVNLKTSYAKGFIIWKVGQGKLNSIDDAAAPARVEYYWTRIMNFAKDYKYEDDDMWDLPMTMTTRPQRWRDWLGLIAMSDMTQGIESIRPKDTDEEMASEEFLSMCMDLSRQFRNLTIPQVVKKAMRKIRSKLYAAKTISYNPNNEQ